MENNKQRCLFVVNPISGDYDKDKIIQKIKERFPEKEYHLTIYKTTGEGDSENILSVFNTKKPEFIVIAGGDGTLNMVIKSLADRHIPIGIIPMGSANGMSVELDIPQDFEKSIDIIKRGNLRKIDLIRVNNKHLCVHLSDIGINARVIKRFSKEKKRGFIGYARQYFKEIFNSRPLKFSIETEHNRIQKKAHMLVIANAKKYGTGAIINPLGKLNDGKFELCLIKPYPFYAIFTLIFAFFTGLLHKIKYVTIISAEHATIKTPKKQDLQIDGEAIGKYNEIKIDILPGAVEIFVPVT